MSYHTFKPVCTVHSTVSGSCHDCAMGHGSFEVFYVAEDALFGSAEQGQPEMMEAGWYWWACFPGCLPDSDPQGPFSTKQEAIDAANEGE
jgi:hypothetical protein